MKRFLIKCFGLIAASVVLSVVLCVLLFKLNPPGLDGYQQGFIYQMDALEKLDLEKPRLIFIGGSYLTFSMDGRLAAKSFDLPVRILGTHSGMGMSYVFEMAARHLRKGDVVVFPFDAFRERYYGMPLIYLAIGGRYDLLADFAFEHPFEILRSAPSFCTQRLLNRFSPRPLLLPSINEATMPDAAYSARWFDKRTGYYELRRDSVWRPEKLKVLHDFDISKIRLGCIDEVNEFNEICKSKGASLLIAFPPLLKDSVSACAEQVAKYESFLSEKLNAPIISHTADNFYSAADIFDNPSHLTSEGSRSYTIRLLKNIRVWQASAK